MADCISHPCRRCSEVFPATEDHFYRAGAHFNWICKPCYIEENVARKRKAAGRPGSRSLQCSVCGTEFKSYRISPLLACSDRCRWKIHNQRKADERLAAKAVRFKARTCLHCGCAIALKARTDAVFCSERCNSAAHQLVRKHAYRAGTKREKLSRAYLGERDGWRCQICHKPVDRELEYPDPLAPSVDHHLPLALRGTNDLANLQLTHLRCNLQKRASVGDMQLRLVG